MSRVLLVEPYLGGSHRAWAEGYRRHSAHDVSLVSHEGQFWRWRMRASALTLAEEVDAHIADHGPPDLMVVSDMVDLPTLLGYSRKSVVDVPVVLYMHENQLLYPLGPRQQPDEALSIINWMSMAAADRVWFNSEFHREALFAALPKLLGRAPDRDHRHRLLGVQTRASVLPVGVDARSLIDGERVSGGAPLVLWNQRWEHDKNPQEFFDLLETLASEGLDFRVALAGENERLDPREFFRGRQTLDERIIHVGHLPRASYEALLLRSDVVVSTAVHEFFGVAAVEAMAAGVVPLLPDRLSYPELIPGDLRAACLYGDGELVKRTRAVLADVEAAGRQIASLRSSMDRFDWSVVAPRYDGEIDRILRDG